VLLSNLGTCVEDSHRNYDIVEGAAIINQILNNNTTLYFNNILIKNDLILDMISKPSTKGTRQVVYYQIEIRNAIVDGIVDLRDTTFKKRVIFDNTIFNNYTFLSNDNFLEDVEFKNCSFNNYTYFRYTKFNNSVDFERSKFGLLDFNDCNFVRSANFKDCKFQKTAQFKNSIFNRVEFENASFYESVYFTGRAFKGLANFQACRFNNNVFLNFCEFDSLCMDHSYIKGQTDLRRSKFNGIADLKFANFLGPTNFESCRFSDQVSFWNSSFNDSLLFRNSIFNDDVDFAKSRFGEIADFSKSKFGGLASFYGTKFQDNADFSFCSFNRTLDIRHSEFYRDANFMDAEFKDDVFADDSQFRGILNLNRTSYNRIFIKWDSVIGKLQYNETAYNLLEKNFKNLGLFEDANRCYYAFMCEKGNRTAFEGFSGRLNSLFMAIFYFFAWILYGFGTRPELPWMWSFILIIGVFTPFWYKNSQERTKGIIENYGPERKKDKNRNLYRALMLSISIFFSGTKILIDPPKIPEEVKGSNPWIGRVYTIERTLGAAFFFLFFLAISKTILSG
jgi:hypothetical protein